VRVLPVTVAPVTRRVSLCPVLRVIVRRPTHRSASLGFLFTFLHSGVAVKIKYDTLRASRRHGCTTMFTVVDLAGFQLVRADRSCTESGKKKGGGVAVYVNNGWCNPGHITVKERVCSPDIELLLAVSLRPYYLPREFTRAIVIVVYASRAADVINSVTARLQTLHPNAFISTSGDFNHATLTSNLPTFKQGLWTAKPGKIKHWTCCMPMLRRHTAPQLSPLWADQITIWST